MSYYSELLKDPKWQKKRLDIFNRDGWACRECDAKDQTLHVHHKQYTYGKPPWETSDEYLITLCESCHSIEESLKQNNLLHSFAKSGDMTCWSLWKLINAMTFLKAHHPDEYKSIKENIKSVISKYGDELSVHGNKNFNLNG